MRFSSDPSRGFSDSDWTRDPPPRVPFAPADSRQRSVLLTTAIALVCIALALVMFGLDQAIDENRRSQAPLTKPSGAPPDAVPDRPSAAMPAAAAASKPDASVAPAPLLAPVAAPAAASAPIADAIERAQLAALEAELRQRAREHAAEAAAEAAKRKERAWERWYQRPPFCNDNPTAAQLVECANHYIRGRKEFEERYATGRL